MAQCRQGDPSSNPQQLCKKLCMIDNVFNAGIIGKRQADSRNLIASHPSQNGKLAAL